MPKKNIRLLVVDYDFCAVTILGTNSKMLSKGLVKYAKENYYDGFYGCTHRCFRSVDVLMQHAMKIACHHNYSVLQVANNYSTYKITENFQNEAGIKCIEVSTLDDLISEECGKAFREIIKPYEENHEKKPTNENNYASVKQVEEFHQNKNRQLLQIALNAVKNFPETDAIHLDFVDDNKEFCNAALNVMNEPNWPKQVKLCVFMHEANCDDAAVISLSPSEPIFNSRVARTMSSLKLLHNHRFFILPLPQAPTNSSHVEEQENRDYLTLD